MSVFIIDENQKLPMFDLPVDFMVYDKITGQLLSFYASFPCKIDAFILAYVVKGNVKATINLWEYDIVPELYDLYNREDAVYFSSNNKIKGIENLYGTGWTTASVISSSIGLPFKVPINNLLFTKDKFLTSL